MSLQFPSYDFDQAVAAVCHGTATDEQIRGLHQILRQHPGARDEYLLRVELHSRMASDPDLFLSLANAAEERNRRQGGVEPSSPVPTIETVQQTPPRSRAVMFALAACLTALSIGWWIWGGGSRTERKGSTSMAVAMLNRSVDAQWEGRSEIPRVGAPLEPGWFRLKSGLVQIVFYSGARVVMEGPTELQIVSPNEALCRSGRLVAEVPPQAKGFRVTTPQLQVTDLGTSFGLDARDHRTELQVFKGSVECQPSVGQARQNLKEGAGMVAERSGATRLIAADPDNFASLFEWQRKSSAADVLRHEQWRAVSARLDEDPSLLVHFTFEQPDTADWRVANASRHGNASSDATLVGCQWVEGRWPEKRALEFRGVSDRVRFNVSGEYESLTLAAWVRVQGLDRQINSLFMSDGFDPGTVHWCIREDGVLGLTAIGEGPGNFQICTSPSVITLDQFGLWVHVAVVVDGSRKRVTHYLNGSRLSEQVLNISAPFRIGAAELGNWNTRGFPKNDPFMIRNFSGGIDEFCLFSRALSAEDLRAMHAAGKPQPDPLRQTRR